MKPYTVTKTVYMGKTDAIGRIYFTTLFDFAHEALEGFLEKIGIPIGDVLKGGKYLLPITHAEADIKKSLVVGDKVTAELVIESFGEHSAVVVTTFTDKDGKPVGKVKIVHVAVSVTTGEKIPFPKEIRSKVGAS